MSKFILLNRIRVENANAVSGFTWGYPSPTHFLGFVNALRLKLNPKLINKDKPAKFPNILLKGCGIFSHTHQVHTYQSFTDDSKQYLDDIQFSQKHGTRYMEYQDGKKRYESAPVIEEAKMNITVSLLIEYEGIIENELEFKQFLSNCCCSMRLAGGSIFTFSDDQVDFYNISDKAVINKLKIKLLPAFVLIDKQDELEKHFNKIKQQDGSKQLYDAWLDFLTLKQVARPKCDLLTQFIIAQAKKIQNDNILDLWERHLLEPYKQEKIPVVIIQFFEAQQQNQLFDEQTSKQWLEYKRPNESTSVDWETQPKPCQGWLVPLMNGYRELSPVIDGRTLQKPIISDARDNTTPICFVEAIHSIGEWKSVHHLRETSDFLNCLWHYQYEDGWYVCTQYPDFEQSLEISPTQEDEFN